MQAIADGALAGRTILMLTRYTEAGPSSRLRFYQYADALREIGATVTLLPFFDDKYVNRLFRGEGRDRYAAVRAYARRLRVLATAKADLVWVEKELFPYMPGAFEKILAVRRLRYVVDYDDAIFHNYDLANSVIVRSLLGNKLAPLLRNAALVTAGNQYLADYAIAHGAREVTILPTVVDLTRYPLLSPQNDGRLRIGWIGTPANTRYLQPVISAMNALRDRIPLMLVTVGAGPIVGLEVPHEQHDWSAELEGELVARFDIGVMPLDDSPWERGKCGYKLIQYMAAGKPTIASAVGVNCEIVNYKTGLLVTDVSGWMEAITNLAEDSIKRTIMGLAGRSRVSDHYSLSSVKPIIQKRFSDLILNH